MSEAGSPGPDPRLAIALDVDGLDMACSIADAVRPWMGVAKVGQELFAAAGPAAIGAMVDRGFAVFADLKFYDIPTTVGRAAAKVGRAGARWLTVPTVGGPDMLRAGVEGLADGSGGTAQVLGVTILTSDQDRTRSVLKKRVALARDSGCGGVICSAADIEVVKEVAPELVLVVPGIRRPGSSHNDQASVATPAAAIMAGASILVIGRTLTAEAQALTAESPQLGETLAEMAERARMLAADISYL
ncbi:orotidine-5'-phosphate decarboxylase [Candidatus Poriferisocius sp.]|uniref:orotidine-5'-phosphate decarboxylase n=1 Tax=Candidatus Poriferisocius sp. TaxID=3101276 RepID=UPI003B023C2E